MVRCLEMSHCGYIDPKMLIENGYLLLLMLLPSPVCRSKVASRISEVERLSKKTSVGIRLVHHRIRHSRIVTQIYERGCQFRRHLAATEQ